MKFVEYTNLVKEFFLKFFNLKYLIVSVPFLVLIVLFSWVATSSIKLDNS